MNESWKNKLLSIWKSGEEIKSHERRNCLNHSDELPEKSETQQPKDDIKMYPVQSFYGLDCEGKLLCSIVTRVSFIPNRIYTRLHSGFDASFRCAFDMYLSTFFSRREFYCHSNNPLVIFHVHLELEWRQTRDEKWWQGKTRMGKNI